MLGKGDTFRINGTFGAPQKCLANTKLCLSLHYNADNSYFLVNVKEIFNPIWTRVFLFGHAPREHINAHLL